MARPLFDVEVVDREFWSMMTRMNATLEPRHFAFRFTNLLRRRFRDQVNESFAGQGATGGESWPALSEWRVADRKGSRSPILVETGSFFSEVLAYKGEVRLVNSGFSMWYPSQREASGRYWGLAAGQLVNPLGATPLAAFPRRVLGGNKTQETASIDAMVRYFTDEGWQVSIGGG